MENFDRLIFDFLPRWGAWLAVALLAVCILAECAWCGKRLGEKDGAGETHGICAECKADLFKEDDDG